MRTSKHDCYRLVQIVVCKQYPVCRMPGCRKQSTVGHHVFPRNRMGTAFNPKAVIALCAAHHDYAHAHPVSFREIAKMIVGSEFDALEVLSRTIVQFRDADYDQIKKCLTMLGNGG
jgi:hypothetical protein